MNNENLIPQAHVLTVAEQSKGGIASGKARRERKTVAQAFRQVLDEPEKAGSTTTRLDGIAEKVIKSLSRKATMKDIKILADILGERTVSVETSGIQLNITTASNEGADNIVKLMNGGVGGKALDSPE